MYEVTERQASALIGEQSRAQRIAVAALPPGSVLHVRTRNSHYDIVVDDGPEGRVLIAGGHHFRQLTAVHVVGATPGDGTLQSGQIAEGLRLHLRTRRSGSVITSTIESILLDGERQSR